MTTKRFQPRGYQPDGGVNLHLRLTAGMVQSTEELIAWSAVPGREKTALVVMDADAGALLRYAVLKSSCVVPYEKSPRTMGRCTTTRPRA